jgi:hypothetical protein
MRTIRWAASALIVVSSVGSAWAQVNVADAQNKLLSKRAAEADAYRKLAEAVKGLQITSDTYVKDFVAESDEIRSALDQCIKGVRLGQPRWFEDLSCEVPGEVTVERIIQLLQETHERYYKIHHNHTHVTAKDIENMQQHVEQKIVKVVGKGAPRPDLPPDLPDGVAEQVALGTPPLPAEPFVPELWTRKHMGPMAAQARLGAERAAEVDAQRKLVERILGLRVDSQTLVRDFITESDQIHTSAVGTLVGASKIKTYYHSDEPIVEVTLQVPVESVVTTIKKLYTECGRCGHVRVSDVTEICRSLKVQTLEATGMGVPNPKFLMACNQMASAPEERIPQWAMAPMRAVGHGVAAADKAGTPQGKLLAARAAEVDAKRNLAEQVKGLSLWANTMVRDFITEHDDVRTVVDAVIANCSVEKTKFGGDGTAEVTVVLQPMQIWDAVRQPAGMPMGPPPGMMSPAPRGAGTPPPARRPAAQAPQPSPSETPPAQEEQKSENP